MEKRAYPYKLLSMMVAFFVMMGAASAAQALSCVPWGISDAYLAAANSNRSYAILQGELSFDTRRLPIAPSGNPNAAPPITQFRGSFSGALLGVRDFDRAVEADVVIEVQCLGPWCGKPMTGVEYILFAEQRGRDLILRFEPCGRFAFSSDLNTRRKELLQCHIGKACVPRAPKSQ